MSFFDQVYKSIFGTKESSSPFTFSHEVIERSEAYEAEYAGWKKKEKDSKLLSNIKNAYLLKKKGIEQDPQVHILTSQYANGIAISYTEFFEGKDFSYLLDLLAERVISLGYKSVNNDVLIREKSGYTETIEKRYLKPVINTDPPLDQKFGNILVEFVRIDDRPSYLKLGANVYSDRLYGTPKKFDDLIDEIFK